MLGLTSALSIKEPALVSRWYLQVPDVSGPYECVAETVELSFEKTAPKGRHFAATQRFYPDFREIDGVTVVFYETWDFQVTKWLTKWKKQVRLTNNAYGYPKDFKKTMTAYLFNQSSNSPILAYEMTGVWPTDKVPWNLTYEDSDGRLQTGCIFSVDACEEITM